jgi:hypothetical protein
MFKDIKERSSFVLERGVFYAFEPGWRDNEVPGRRAA